MALIPVPAPVPAPVLVPTLVPVPSAGEPDGLSDGTTVTIVGVRDAVPGGPGWAEAVMKRVPVPVPEEDLGCPDGDEGLGETIP